MNSLRIVALILVLAGLPALFLPFAYGTTPFETALDFSLVKYPVWYMAAATFLAVAIAAWLGRRFLRRKISRGEVVLVYLLSAAAMLPILIITIVTFPPRSSTAIDYGVIAGDAGVWILALLNVFLLVRNISEHKAPEDTAEIFLLGSYPPNAMLPLIAFLSHLQSGGILVAIACVGCVLNIVLVIRRSNKDAVQPVRG